MMLATVIFLSCFGQCGGIQVSDTLPTIPSDVQPSVKTAFVLPGDGTGDGVVTLADVIYLINYTLKGGPPPVVPDSADTRMWYWQAAGKSNIVIQLGALP